MINTEEMSGSAKCMRLTMVVRKGFSEKVTAELTKKMMGENYPQNSPDKEL